MPKMMSDLPSCSITKKLPQIQRDGDDLPTSDLDNFELTEEIRNLERGRVRAVRTMNGVTFDIRRVELSNRTGVRFCGIGSSHDFPQSLDGVVTFEDCCHDWAFRHEGHEAAKKRSGLVNVVEAFGFR